MVPTWMRKAFPGAIAAAIGVSVAVIFTLSLRPLAPAQAQGTADPAKALFEGKCAACHDLPNPRDLMYTRRQWRATVNEMLYQHGALYNPQTNSGITTEDADEIVNYLAQFAPRPGRQRPVNPTDTGPDDVWTSEPLQSRSFTFTSADDLSAFDSQNGEWKVIPGANIGDGYLKCRPDTSFSTSSKSNDLVWASLLIDKKDAVTGDMDLRVSFKVFQAPGQSTIGLVTSYQDTRNYSAIEYDPATQSLHYIVVAQGVATTLQTQDLPGTATAGPDGWHVLRVVEHNNGQSFTAWLDYDKRFTGSDPNTKPGGRVGLYSGAGAVAAFRQMALDIYAPASASDTLN